MRANQRSLVRIGIVAMLLVMAPATSQSSTTITRAQTALTTLDWPSFGNDLANTRYQDVDQITPSNVAQLKPAWIFHAGVLNEGSSFEVSPSS